MSNENKAPASGATPDANTAAGRGGRNRRGGRAGRGGRGEHTARKPAERVPHEGEIAEMNGHIFQCESEASEIPIFGRTLEELHSHLVSKDHADGLAPLFETPMKVPTLVAPVLKDDATDVEKDDYRDDRREYRKALTKLNENLAFCFSVIMKQCSLLMRSKVKSLERFAQAKQENDCFWLLTQVRNVTLQFDDTKKLGLSLLDARSSFLCYKQKEKQSVDDYVANLRAWADAIEAYGGHIAEFPRSAAHQEGSDVFNDPAPGLEEYKKAREGTLALAIIRGADPIRFESLRHELSNAYLMGNDKYPADSTAAYYLLTNYKAPVAHRPKNSGNGNQGRSNSNVAGAPSPNAAPSPAPETTAMTFAQVDACVPGDDGKVHAHITCRECNQPGHFANHCPSNAVTETGTTLVQHAYSLAHASHGELDPSWILLDSQSTISVFKNPNMLSNIRPGPRVLHALTNGGSQRSYLVGDFPNLGTVWYNPESIANILSLADVRRVCHVTFDSAVELAFTVHRLDGTKMKFVEAANGLYIFAPNSSESAVSVYSLLQTVASQKAYFTQREIEAADAARDLYRKIGRPSEEEFQRILRQNLIRDCPGTTRRGADAPHVPSFRAVPIPAPILEFHREVTLCADFLYVQGIPFYHSISRKIGFRTLQPVPDRSKKTILRESEKAINLYTVRGFTVSDMHCDNEFACIRENIRPINLDVVPADSHVGEVERSIQTLRNRTRTAVHGLPFKYLPRLMVMELVKNAVRCLNMFPWKNGISDSLSPASIVTGAGNPSFHQLSLEFGVYVQVYEPTSPTNTLHSRTVGAIALGPTGNANGDYAFLSLASGKRITRHQWTVLPMTDDTIARVHALAIAEDQPCIQDSGLVFEWRPDRPIDDDEYDADYSPKDVLDESLDSDFSPIDDDELLSLSSPSTDHFPTGFDQGATTEIHEIHENTHDATNSGVHPGANQGASHEENADTGAAGAVDNSFADEVEPPSEDHGVAVVTADESTEIKMDNTHGYSLRARGERHNSTFKQTMDQPHSGKSYYPPMTLLQEATEATADEHVPEGVRRVIFACILTQMSEKVGLRKHGELAEAALLKEFQQLDDLTVFIPRYATELTNDERNGALRALNLLKEKRDGSLKGRTVADGRKQRSLYDKSETASPTVSCDALLTSVMIDANEGRDVAICDVAGAYLKAFMDDFVVLKFTGKAVDILCKMDEKYVPYVVTEGGRNVIYVQLKKALYGCVKSALLWYKLFSETLGAMGFELNPYDQCVANCDFGGKQCTIVWYVDDMKVSHVDENVVSAVVENIESSFGKMSVTRGKEHEFLGMRITYNSNKTATVTMKSYLEEAIVDSGLEIKHSASTPAKKFLFDVDDLSPRLTEERGDIFHSISAKLLYVATRARMDILLPVCFLCTRVSKATKEDEMKLKRVLEYLHGTMDLAYTIGADDLGKMRTWVDASYAVHPDMRSHTGGVISFGTGGIICKSSKQKLNTKSSTEAELVGASDYLPNTIWMKMFLEEQGHRIEENIFEQDNESAIKLEKNGRTSAGPKSRHIAIRYFFIKDRVKSEGIEIRHCPTLRMLADFFTKPLQGSLFTKLRDVIMGNKHISSLEIDEIVPNEERVGSCDSETISIHNETNEDTKRMEGGGEKTTTSARLKAKVATLEKSGSADVAKYETSKTVTWAQVAQDGCEKWSFSQNNPGITN